MSVEKHSYKPTAIDMFCGAGIGAIGLVDAGYDIVYSSDISEKAVASYNHNHTHKARVEDITCVNSWDVPYADIIAGGFPCQSFSTAGRRDGFKNEKTGNLAFHFWRMVNEIKPLAFLIENVGGITAEKFKDDLDLLKKSFTEAGYKLYSKKLDCWEYGIPQNRIRFFIVGIRSDIKEEYVFPDPIPEKDRKTIKDAVWDIKDKLCQIPNHCEYYKGGFSPRWVMRNQQRQWDQPAYTVISSDRHLTLYPEPPNYDVRITENQDVNKMPRRWTPRECLRLQGVPDWFVFPEDVSLGMQYHRCSGIPPAVMTALVNPIKQIILNFRANKTPQFSIISDLKNFIHPLGKKQKRMLAKDIVENGCRDPLVVWKEKNTIVDGHNRYEICLEHGISFTTKEMSFPDIDAVKDFMLNNQLIRRNLSSFEKVELFLRYKGGLDSFKNSQKNKIIVGKKFDVYKSIAEQASVSHDTVHRCLFILENATEEDKDLLRQDAVSVNSVYMKIKNEKAIKRPRVDWDVKPGAKYKISDSVLEVGNNTEEIKKVLRSIVAAGLSVSEF
jgi:DNA (cytosine-5)-methyltransferase 1